jgi:hypothetical protein
MSDENLQQEEEVKETTPNSESESDESSELDELFEDEPKKETPSVEERLARMEKGLSKFFSEQGRKKEEPTKPEPKAEAKGMDDEIIEEVALTKFPEAEHVLDQAKQIAKSTGRNLLKVLREESWLIDKAKAVSEAKRVEEEAKLKINKPSSGLDSPKVDISQVKPEDVAKLKPADKIKWLKLQAEKESQAD